jgi:uncharacterized protein (TIGR01777 family)
MKIILTGGTGFIGTALRESLTQKEHEVVVLTRQAAKEKEPGILTRYRLWDPEEGGSWESEVDGADGVINLAGEPLVGKWWTTAQKQKIIESRVGATQAVVSAIRKAKKKPQFLINASAIGYYGPRQDEEVTEESHHGNDFLAHTCQAWEAHALRAEDFGVRVIRLRTGIVLEKGGGALAKMLLPFRLGLGGPLGSGKQWMSWVHREDLVNLIHFLIEKKEAKGAVNGTAPNPARMKEFAATLGRVLHRPAVLPAPAFAIRMLLGEMAAVLLTGQRVVPKKALGLGYQFRYPKLEDALKAILSK